MLLNILSPQRESDVAQSVKQPRSARGGVYGSAGWLMGETDVVTVENEVQRIEDELRQSGWAVHASIEREVRNWTRLSESVNTYKLTVDDYTNDLSSRDYLAEVASPR